MSVEVQNGGLSFKASIDTSDFEKDAKKIEKIISSNQKKSLQDFNKIARNISRESRQVTQDAIESFDQLDNRYKRSITSIQLFEVQAKKLRQAEKELNEELARGSITQGQYNNSLRAIKAELLQIQISTKGLVREIQSQVGAQQTQNLEFDKLDKNLTRVNRNFASFGYSSAQGLSGLSNNLPGLVEEIIRLKTESDSLNKQGMKTPSVFSQVVSSLLSWQTILIGGIAIISTYRKEIADWIKSLFGAKKEIQETEERQKALNRAFEDNSYKQAVKDVTELRTNIELAKNGIIKAETVIKQYNETLGKATGKVEDLKEAENGLIQNSDKYIRATFLKAAANIALQDAAEKAFEVEKRRFELQEQLAKAGLELQKQIRQGERLSGTGATSNITSAQQKIKNLGNELVELNKTSDKEVDKFNRIFQKLQSEAANLLPGLFDEEKEIKKKSDDNINARKDLLKKIEELDREYSRKSFSQDEQEIKALKDKFQKVRELVDEFNRDPKNANVKIDLAGLDEIQARAESDLIYRQETNKLKDSLDERKKLYIDFEKFAKDFGIQAAERRFSQELDITRTYIDLIQEEYDKLALIAPQDLSGPQKERLTFLSEELKKEKDAQQRQFDELLKSLQDYNTKRELLIEQHELKIQKLRETGQSDYVKEAERQYQEEIDALDISQIKKLELFETFFKGVENLSTRNAKKLIEDIRNLVQELRAEFPNLSGFFDDIEVKISAAEFKIGERIPQDLIELSTGFRRVSQEVAGVNKGLSQMLAILSDNLARVSEIQRGIANFKSAKQAGDGFSAVTAGLGIAGAVAGGIITLVSLFKRSREQQAQMLREQLEFQRKIYFGELEINRLIRERAIEQAKIEGNTLASLMAQKDALKLRLQEIQKDVEGIESRFSTASTANQMAFVNSIRTQRDKNFDLIFSQLQSLFYDTGETMVQRTGLFGLNKRTVKIFKDLSGLNFEEIQNLSIRGQLTEEAEAVFQQLKKLKDEGENVERQLQEIENQMKSIFTGGATANAIADTLISGFQQGKRAVEDFGDDIEEILRNAILSGFKYRFLEAPLNDLLEQLYKDAVSDDELSQVELQNFQQQFGKIVEEYSKVFEDLQNATGIDLSGITQGQNGLAGAIRRELTEATGSELAGLWRGQFDITKRQLQVAQDTLQIQFQIERNTFNTVEELIQTNRNLEKIIINTKSGSIRDIGLD